MNLLSEVNDRILVIDDNPAIHDDFRKILNPIHERADELAATESILFDETNAPGPRLNFHIESAFQGKEGLEIVERAIKAGQRFAMAFVDVRMPPGWDGVETVARIWKIDPDLQIVICTAYSDYSWGEIDRTIGKSDNLVILKKPFDNIEVLQLSHSLTKKWRLTQQANCKLNELEEMVRFRTQELQGANQNLQREIEERRLVEEALRVSEELFSRAFRSSPIPMAIVTLDEDRHVDVNDQFLTLVGFPRDQVIGKTSRELQLWEIPEAHDRVFSTLQNGRPVADFECKVRTKSLVLKETLVSLERFSLQNKPHVLVVTRDISEKLRLEGQLRHSQKMEAIGKLAAGVAHDFNNTLTIIQGYSSLSLSGEELDPEVKNSFTEILTAAERASTLTQQLLAFSSKQMFQLRALNLGRLIENLTNMLERIIGEDVRLFIRNAPELPPVIADAGNIEQVIMNLVLNARDAMPKGGTLTIETDLIEVNDLFAKRNPEAAVGRFICMSVSDTGCGMDPTVQSRVFESSFTPREFGKGTGLGLAMVYGIVTQHNGWIDVTSKPDQGSSFKIFLPVGEAESLQPVTPGSTSETVPGTGERILIVEDEKGILELAKRVLLRSGYHIQTAPNAAQALQIWDSVGGNFDILLTDVVMPGGMSGKELAKKLKSQKPCLKVIFTSGYSVSVLGTEFEQVDRLNYLQKPYRADLLIQTVRNCLDSA